MPMYEAVVYLLRDRTGRQDGLYKDEFDAAFGDDADEASRWSCLGQESSIWSGVVPCSPVPIQCSSDPLVPLHFWV